MNKKHLFFAALAFLFSTTACNDHVDSSYLDTTSSSVSEFKMNYDVVSTPLKYTTIDYDKVTYSTDNRHEDYFEYELNTEDDTYTIVNIKKEYEDFTDTIYIPISHDDKNISCINWVKTERNIMHASSIIFPKTFSKIITIFAHDVKKLVLPRTMDYFNWTVQQNKLTDLILPETCKEFIPIRSTNISSITYPKGVEVINLPTSQYVKQIIIPESAKKINPIINGNSNKDTMGIVEVYNFSSKIDYFDLLDVIPTLKSVKESLDITSDIVEANNLLFFIDREENDELSFLGFCTSYSDLIILPRTVDNKTYTIKKCSFEEYASCYKSLVVPSGIEFIEEKAFFNCSIHDIYFEDEMWPEEYHTKFVCIELLGESKNNDERCKINYHMGGTWEYVDGIPTVI